MNIREIITTYQERIKEKSDLNPGEASEILAELSALIGNINDEIRKKEMAYNQILLKAYNTEEKANRAKIFAETTPEFFEKLEARDTKELLIEMIRSLKYLIKAKSEELMHSGGM